MFLPNPALDLDDRPEVGLFNWLAEDDAYLFMAVDVTLPPPTPKYPLWVPFGMILTRPPEEEQWGSMDLMVWQVTRSALANYAPPKLGPRLYEYAMYILSLEPLTAAMAPDSDITDAALRVWRQFKQRGWQLNDELPASAGWFAYGGDEDLTLQLQAAESRTRRWVDRLIDEWQDPDEVEATLLRGAFETFGQAMDRIRGRSA